MHADGMSSEDSNTPGIGGILLKKRKAVWQSTELQEFLKAVRSQMGIIVLNYVKQDEPLISMRPAPAGLEELFYDPEYVKNLSTAAREQLNVKQSQ